MSGRRVVLCVVLALFPTIAVAQAPKDKGTPVKPSREWSAVIKDNALLKEAPKNPAERQSRRDNEHLDAAAGVDGIEAFYDQCVANGATILKPLAPTAWGTKDFYIEDPDGYIVSFGGRAVAD